jgi:hypothetical protein
VQGSRYGSNGYEIPPDDPDCPDAVTTWVVGDHVILYVFVIGSMPNIPLDTLTMTLYEAFAFDELVLYFDDGHEDGASVTLTPPIREFTYTRTHRDVEMWATASAGALDYRFINRGDTDAWTEPRFSLYLSVNDDIENPRWWDLTAGLSFPEPAIMIPAGMDSATVIGGHVWFELYFAEASMHMGEFALPEGIYKFEKPINGGSAAGGYELRHYFLISDRGWVIPWFDSDLDCGGEDGGCAECAALWA